MRHDRRVGAVVGGIALCFALLPGIALGFHASHADCQAVDSPPASGSSLSPDATRPPARPREGRTEVAPDTTSGRGNREAPRQRFFSSPTGTLLKSVAFPGWGQWCNGKKQKAAVYFGIESYFITKSLIWRHRARQNDDFATLSHARDRRNYFFWLTGLTIFISMFDAYADRYLLTLEQTQDRPDEFWGGQASADTGGWRLLLGRRF